MPGVDGYPCTRAHQKTQHITHNLKGCPGPYRGIFTMPVIKPIEDVIRNIESLFPVDSGFDDTNAVGERLLEQAKRNCNYEIDWRDLPDNVLREYERLCIAEDNKPAKR